jgi:hypothetical protein
MEETYRRAYRGSYRTYRADMHKTDLPIAPDKRHARYFISTDAMQFLRATFPLAAHRLKFLCTLHKKSKSCASFRSIGSG